MTKEQLQILIAHRDNLVATPYARTADGKDNLNIYTIDAEKAAERVWDAWQKHGFTEKIINDSKTTAAQKVAEVNRECE